MVVVKRSRRGHNKLVRDARLVSVPFPFKFMESQDHDDILDTVEGEIYFFRSLMRSRPVGMHRHFHVMSMRNAILKGTGRAVSVEAIWNKLKECYNLEALEALVCSFQLYHPLNTIIQLQEVEYESSSSSSSTPVPVPSPKPNQNLAAHPAFKSEYSLPADPDIEKMIVARRMRNTISLPSSPEPAPQMTRQGVRTRRRTLSKVDMAGLVSGDSDSSALTQDSEPEDRGQSPKSRRGSVIGTEGGTEDVNEDIDIEAESSPGKGKLYLFINVYLL